jgi:predicted  nucleic acid-binding Zn-ribbon protein
MSDTGTESEVTVTADGVTVTKSYEPERFSVPAIAFGIRSERDTPATIRIVDTVPEGVSVDDIGFHPEYGREHWEVDGRDAIFERDLDADAEELTVYGVRAVGEDTIERFITEPALDVTGEESTADPATEPGSTSEPAAESASTTGAGSTAGAGASTAGESTAAEATASGGGATDGTDATAGTGGDASADVASAESTGTAPGGAAPPSAAAGGVAAALAAELRDGEVDRDDRERIVSALGDGEGAGGGGDGTDARIKNLQSRVSDIEAYSDALEEFIEGTGPARQVLDDLDERVGEIDGHVAALDERVGEIDARVADNAEAAESLDASLETVRADVDALRTEVEDADLDALRADVEAVREDVEAVRGDVEAVQEDVEAVRADVETVREEAGGADADELAALRTEVKELEAWRRRVSDVLGGSAGGS